MGGSPKWLLYVGLFHENSCKNWWFRGSPIGNLHMKLWNMIFPSETWLSSQPIDLSPGFQGLEVIHVERRVSPVTDGFLRALMVVIEMCLFLLDDNWLIDTYYRLL